MRRWSTALVVAGLAGAEVVAAAPAVSAANTTCLVADTTSDHSYGSLQAAADAAAAGDTLFVKRTCAGTTTIGKDLTVAGHSNGGDKTETLNGNQQGSVLTIGSGVVVTLNGLVITNGAFAFGGGILNIGGTVTLNDGTITGNTASVSGGGIYKGCTLNLNDTSTVSSNTARQGGGIANTGALNLNAPGR